MVLARACGEGDAVMQPRFCDCDDLECQICNAMPDQDERACIKCGYQKRECACCSACEEYPCECDQELTP